MARYPFNYRSEEAQKELMQEMRDTQPCIVAEARNKDGSSAIRVIEKSDEKAYVVYAPGWRVNRHNRNRLVANAEKRLREARAYDAEATRTGKPATAVNSLRHLATISGSWLEPVSYLRQLSSTNEDFDSTRRLENYCFILDGKMNDGIHESSYWRDYLLKCKDHKAITLGELYDSVSTYHGKKIRLSLNETYV